QVKWLRRRDYLNRLAVSEIEGCPQSLVASSDIAERPLQRDRIEFSSQRDGAHEVVSGVARLKLVEEPEPSLREGQRVRPALFAAGNPLGLGGLDSLLDQQRFQNGSTFSRKLEYSFLHATHCLFLSLTDPILS